MPGAMQVNTCPQGEVINEAEFGHSTVVPQTSEPMTRPSPLPVAGIAEVHLDVIPTTQEDGVLGVRADVTCRYVLLALFGVSFLNMAEVR